MFFLILGKSSQPLSMNYILWDKINLLIWLIQIFLKQPIKVTFSDILNCDQFPSN